MLVPFVKLCSYFDVYLLDYDKAFMACLIYCSVRFLGRINAEQRGYYCLGHGFESEPKQHSLGIKPLETGSESTFTQRLRPLKALNL